MIERIKWIILGDKEILFTDYSGLNSSGISQLIDKVYDFYRNKPLNSILSLSDLRKIEIDKYIFEKFKQLDYDTGKFDKKTAIVGLNIFKQTLLNLVNRFNKNDVKGFKTQENAIRWLIK